MRFLLVAVLISALSQGYVGLKANSYRTLERRRHVSQIHTDRLVHELPQKSEANIDEEKPKEKSFQGLRCDQTLYAPVNLKDAANEACQRIRNGKKTWSFPRFPVSFPMDSTHLIDDLLENPGAETVDGPYFLYPIKSDGKTFKYGFSGPHRIITNRKCQILGAVVIVKSKVKCKGISCLNIFRKKHVAYKTCHEDYRR